MMFCSGGGGEKTAPIVGGVDVWSGGDGNCWFRLVSDCVLPAYIYDYELQFWNKLGLDLRL